MIYSNIEDIKKCLADLLKIQTWFRVNHGVSDIFSNSKFYEIIIANQLGHNPIPGHSGSRDATDIHGNEVEYKHFKMSSSNHSWTFNDFSDSTIYNMRSYLLVFAHINDVDYVYPGIMDWYYVVDGELMSHYLEAATTKIMNSRKMINVSENQLVRLGCQKTFVDIGSSKDYAGSFQQQLKGISELSLRLEELTGVRKILTSNKIYELLVAMKLNHEVNSEQGGRIGAHDAEDSEGNTYEYKVYKSRTWNFQDISDAVLEKYLDDKKIILAVVDKTKLEVKEIYSVNPDEAVTLLKSKLDAKISKLAREGKTIRRKQIGLSFSDISRMRSFRVLLNR